MIGEGKKRREIHGDTLENFGALRLSFSFTMPHFFFFEFFIRVESAGRLFDLFRNAPFLKKKFVFLFFESPLR